MIAQLVQAQRRLMADTPNPESLSAEMLEQRIARARELEAEAGRRLDHLALMDGVIHAHARAHPGDTVQADALQPGFDKALEQLESIRSGKGKEWTSSLLSALAMRLEESGDRQGALRALSGSARYRLTGKESAWLGRLAQDGDREARRLLETYGLAYAGNVKLPPTQFPRGLTAGPGRTVFVSDRLGDAVLALDLDTGRHRLVAEGLGHMNGVRVQDERLVACNTEGRRLLFFDARTLSPLGELDVGKLARPLTDSLDGPDAPWGPYHCLRHAGEMHVVLVPSSFVMQSTLISFREDDPAGTMHLTPLDDLRLTDLMVLDGRLTGVNLTPGFLATIDPENGTWRRKHNGPQGDVFYCSAQRGDDTFLAGKHRIMRLSPNGELIMHRHSDLVTGLTDTYPVACALLDGSGDGLLCVLDNHFRTVHMFKTGGRA